MRLMFFGSQSYIHKAHFKYKRWGLDGVNVKTGETWLKLASVEPLHIQTEIVKDTSYFSHYLTVHGTDIQLKPLIAASLTPLGISGRCKRLRLKRAGII